MSVHTFVLNGKRVSVNCAGNVRMLWVIRDILGVHGPKYGCGLGVCQACTSHLNGKAVNLCAIEVSQIKPRDHIVTIEGLPHTVGKALHPMQQAWLDYDVAQCGYCQPGQIMAAVALVKKLNAEGRDIAHITDAELDGIRNICRCGTYPRIREAIRAGALQMHLHKPKKKRKKSHKPAKHAATKHASTQKPAAARVAATSSGHATSVG